VGGGGCNNGERRDETRVCDQTTKRKSGRCPWVLLLLRGLPWCGISLFFVEPPNNDPKSGSPNLSVIQIKLISKSDNDDHRAAEFIYIINTPTP